MTGYWLGLLTLPAAAGALALLYGAWKAGGWLIDHSPIVAWRHSRPDDTANTAAAIASSPAVVAVQVSRFVTVLVGIGRVDQKHVTAVRRAVYRELVPPVRLTPNPKYATAEDTDA